MDLPAVVVLDNGSATLKAGLSTESDPTVVIPMVVNKFIKDKEFSAEDIFTVDSAVLQQLNKSNCISYPIENGIVTNWDCMEKIWDYTFNNQLKIKPEDHPILLTEAPHNPNSNRDNMAQIMFEKFSTPSMCVMIQGVLSLYGAGQLNGIALEIGHGVTQIVPIAEGYMINSAVNRTDFAGCDLTDYLMKEISNETTNFTTRIDKEIIQIVKEKFCYVCEDLEQESKMDTNTFNHTLPDGRNIKIGSQKYQCPEFLFKPALASINSKGIHKLLNNSIQSCAVDLKKTLYSNIVLAGGTAMLDGLNRRLEKEMTKVAPEGTKVKVKAPRNKHTAWMGAAILANHSSFPINSITKQQYEEHGSSILHKDQN